MNITIQPGLLHGRIYAIPSKSFFHRAAILSAFCEKPTDLVCAKSSNDILSTIGCMSEIGAKIHEIPNGYRIEPVQCLPKTVELNCHDSGSTLRFLLPVIGALGIDGVFITEGRLASRPLSPLWEEMERMGCHLFWEAPNRLRCTGQLKSGAYHISGNISSQFITGLMLGLQLLSEKSTLNIHGTIQSAPYLDITKEVMLRFGLDPHTFGGQMIRSPGKLSIEGDWSSASFYLGANVLGSDVQIDGLNTASVHGDRTVTLLLDALEHGSPEISAAQNPDLIPILAVVAAGKNGAVFMDIQRLRMKESDRVATVSAMLTALGIAVESTESTLRVWGGQFTGGTVNACNDHRIAMAAAIAATIAQAPVTVLGAECVEKSYPDFWEDFKLLGGQYELNIR